VDEERAQGSACGVEPLGPFPEASEDLLHGVLGELGAASPFHRRSDRGSVAAVELIGGAPVALDVARHEITVCQRVHDPPRARSSPRLRRRCPPSADSGNAV
jgi:hypothetical protein